MDVYWFVLTLSCIVAATIAFLWLGVMLKRLSRQKMEARPDPLETEVARVFSDSFREELKNRGRLTFEKIISENAMFLKHDLQLTASQLNEFMQDSIKKVLREEFSKYEKSIEDARDIAIQSIQKTQSSVEAQRAAMEKQLQAEIEAEKQRVLAKFDRNMAQVVNHYLLDALGQELKLEDQLGYIVEHLESNKASIVEDIRSGT